MKKWIVFKFFRPRVRRRKSQASYLKYKETARKFVLEKINFYNQFYNFKIRRISIRNQRTRWGSCSQNGNLNFNYKIIFLPEELADYIIVHEICHLGKLNHSRDFWRLVAKTVPDYSKKKKKLRTMKIL